MKAGRILVVLLGLLLLLTLMGGALAEEHVLKLPDSLEIIEEEAFQGDTSLDKVELPNGVEEIRACAFAGSSLSEIFLPDSLTFIDDTAFDGSDKVTVTANANSYAYNWAVAKGYLEESRFETTLLDDGTLEITGYVGKESTLVIPGVINGVQVSSIGLGAFSENDTITNVTISEGIQCIGDDSFFACTKLESISLPESLNDIGWRAFWQCYRLKTLVIPENVEYIGYAAFACCTGLTSITVPGSVHMEEWVFETESEDEPWSDKLTSVTISNGGTELDFAWFFRAFKNLEQFIVADDNESYSTVDGVLFDKAQKKLICCPKAKSGVYEVPAGVTEIGDKAFCFCEKLTKVVIPDSVETLGNNLFGACRLLTEVELPSGVTCIGDSMFYNCDSLTTFTIPEGVTLIEEFAFGDCDNLASVTIPESVTEIQDYVFDGHMADFTIYGKAGSYAETYATQNNITFVPEYSPLSDFWIEDGVILGYNGPGGYVVIPPADEDGNPIVAIDLSDSTTITNIWIPNTVQEIASFHDCTALERLVIPESVESTLLWPLAGCTNLAELTIPGTLEVAEGNSDLFDNYGESGSDAPGKLTKVTLSNGGTNLDVTNAFARAYNLTEFAVLDGNTTYSCHDGVLYNAAGTKLIKCPNAKTSYTFPNGITEIGDRAFRNCWKLTSIEIPDSVTVLGDNLFGACASLVEVRLPAGITSIGDDMFYNCDSLTKFVIPDGVTTIGDYAFGDCDNLVSVTIPSSVTSIGYEAFGYCGDGLTIYGTAGSYAQTYAAENGLTFVAE